MTDKLGNKPIEHVGRTIRAEIRTAATPEQAYQAWVTPADGGEVGKKFHIGEVYKNQRVLSRATKRTALFPSKSSRSAIPTTGLRKRGTIHSPMKTEKRASALKSKRNIPGLCRACSSHSSRPKPIKN